VKITFSDLKEISENLEKGNDQFLVDYLNRFEGYNIYDKFKNILKSWETDVSYQLSINLVDKNVKIQLEYIINNIPTIENEYLISVDDCEYTIQIPKYFSYGDDIIPIYDIIKNVEIFGIFLNLENSPFEEKKKIIDNFPPLCYNSIISNINKCDKILTFDGEIFSKFRLNFLTNDPYHFLKSLFLPYGKNYFREVIFHLSKRVDSNILMNSTIQDIDFYIEKYNDEMKDSQNNNPSL
jgi:hypothetical protein